MKKILLLVFYFAFQAGVFAQDYHYADSLKHLIATEQEEDTTTVIHYLRLASYYTWSFPDTAIMYYQKAYLLSNRLEFRRGLIYALDGQAYPLSLVREDSAAISSAFKSIRLAEEAKDNRRLARAWFTLGSVYIHLRDFEKGLLYHRKALGYASSSDTDFINVTNQHIAGCFLGLNQPDSADMYAKKVLQYNKLHQKENGYDVYQMGSVFFQKGLLDSALRYYREGLAMVTKQDIRKDMANCNLGIANVFQERQVYDSAIYYAKAAWKIAGMTGLANEKLEALDQLTSLFAATGNTDSAFVYQQYALQLKDNIYNADKVRQVQLLAFNEELRKQQEAEEQRSRSNRILVYSLLAVLAFTIIIAGIIYRNNKQRQKAYALLKRQKEEIDRQKRDIEIEAALERLRAKAMSMHHSDELDEVLAVLCEQFDLLGILPMSAHMTVLDIENNKFTFRETGKFGNRSFGEQTVALDAMDTWKDMVESWKNAEPYSINSLHFPKETLPQVWEVFHESFASMPEGSRITPDDYPDGIYHTAGKHPYGYIGMNQTRKATVEEEQIVMKFASEFGRAYTRFLDLQKAEAQAREAQIEAAQERVRSKTMGMQRSEQLGETASILFKQFDDLGIKVWSSGFQIWKDDNISTTAWMSSAGGEIQSTGIRLPHTEDPYFINIYNARNTSDRLFVMESKGKELEETYRYMFNIPEWKKQFGDIEDAGFPIPKYQITHCVYFTHGYLMLITHESYPEYWDIFKRFGKVFDQTYTRFLDLQKAEAQARESQIQLAMERVRARSMAMQKSEELAEVSYLLNKQVVELGIPTRGCAFNIYNEHDSTEWFSDLEGTFPAYQTPRENIFLKYYEAGQRGESLLVEEFGGERIKELYRYFASLNGPVDERLTEHIETAPDYQINHMAYFKYGYLLFVSLVPCPEAHEIFVRFAREFEQTYTRFLDLQKAEAQAREAQIQLSLERIRAKAMAIQHSDELSDFLTVVFEQFEVLQLNPVNCHLSLLDLENNRSIFRLTGKNGATLIASQEIDLDSSAVLKQKVKSWKSGHFIDVDVLFTPFESLPEFAEIFKEILDKMPEEDRPLPEDWPDGQYVVEGYCKFGYLEYSTSRAPSEEEKEITRRIANEFGNVYQRFLDLEKAEAQAREATKQASLDRVRGVISSMRSATDLELITPLIFKELTILDVPFIRCGVFIIHEKQEIVEAYLSSPEGNSLGVLQLPFQASELTYQTVEAWRKGIVYRQHWNKEDFVRWIDELMKQDQIQDKKTYQGAAAPPESLDLHFVPFAQGMLYVGSIGPLGEEEIDLVKSLAKAFSIAYARYEDFVKLDKAKADIEHAMAELKSTQSQLVQQEKLASLGQLTAGIAHEIKNPLNFVNNFSEVSIEMIEEAIEELEKREARDETLIRDNLGDIRSNLQKVHEHGTRANGIVTSMLQHSREGSGKKEPTNLNALIKEYVNLSFHGMRAGKNPINVVIDLQLDEQIKEIPLIGEDFSRVLLNLCNNAFDAMREKMKKYEEQSTMTVQRLM